MYRKYPRFVKVKPTVIQIVGIEIARKKLQNTNFQNDAYCGYWQYQQIAVKKLQNFTCQSCFLWVLNLWQQKRNTKLSTNVSNLQSEVAKWSGVRPALSWGFFHCVNPKNEHGLTPLHMATINIQFLKYVNIVLQIKIQK